MFKLKLARTPLDADADTDTDTDTADEIVTRQPPPGHGTARRRSRRQALADELVQMAGDDPAP